MRIYADSYHRERKENQSNFTSTINAVDSVLLVQHYY